MCPNKYITITLNLKGIKQYLTFLILHENEDITEICMAVGYPYDVDSPVTITVYYTQCYSERPHLAFDKVALK